MKKKYEEQRERVENARKANTEEKKFKSPSGVEYSAAQLKAAGEKAKKDARKSRISKTALIALGALAGAWLVPMVLTSVFTGVMAVSTLSTLSAVGGVAGLIGGGLLGRTVYNMGGRKEKLENNDALAKFMAENMDALNIQEADLQAQEEALRNLERDFDLSYDSLSGTMESATFTSVYDEFGMGPFESEEEIELEPEVEVFETEETESESEETEEAESETEETEETESETEETEETESETEETEETESETEETEAESETEEVETEGDTAETEDDTADVEGGEEIPERPETGDAVAPTEEQIKKHISVAKAKYSRAINSGVCSPVGQYMLVVLREQAEDNIRACSTVEEMQDMLEIASEMAKQIVSDYRKYTAQDGKYKSICLRELPESEQGKDAAATSLPAEFEARVDDKTYVGALKRGYVKTNEKLVNGYIQSIGADETTASEIRERAKMDLISSLSEASDFEGVSRALAETEAKMNAAKDEMARRINKTEKDAEEDEEEALA